MEYKSDVNPDDDAREAVNKIINARQAGEVVILIGDCTINYEGRAWSYTEGRHSVTMNPSGSIVIHHPSSVKAKNWQPKGASTSVSIDEDDEIIVRSVRKNPDEVLVVRFTNLIKSMHYKPSDDEIELKGSEKEMHKYIYNNPSIISRDFSPKEMEKQVKTGDIDIYGKLNNKDAIVEVKRKKAQQEDVGQLRRYVDMFNQAQGFLVAPDITSPAREVLESEYEFVFVELSPSKVIE
jgi:RecB family endonuclease NucS